MNQFKKSYRQLEGMIKEADEKLKENMDNLPEKALSVINGTLNASVEYANGGNFAAAFGLLESVKLYFGGYLKW